MEMRNDLEGGELPSGTSLSSFTLQTTHALFLPEGLVWFGWGGMGGLYHLALIFGVSTWEDDD
jgi:hypothetical protein